MCEYRELLSTAHVWHLDPHQIGAARSLDECLAWLSNEERARCELLRTDQARSVYLLTRSLCRATLSRYTGIDPAAWVFAEREGGKPVISHPLEFRGLHFNLTHTQGLIVCAVTRIGEIGVDAEETSRAIEGEGIARHFFSDAERAEIARLPGNERDRRVFEIWVLKEAYLKGSGTGLMQSPKTFTIQGRDDGKIAPLEGWQLALHRPTLRHVAATAVRADAPVPVTWRPYEEID